MVAEMTPLDAYVGDILGAVRAESFYSALALSLVIPEICGAIEYPAITDSNERYRTWFREWCGLLHSLMTPADCWAIRCSYLHLARDQFSGAAAKHADLANIFFTKGKTEGGWYSTFFPMPTGPKGAVRIPVETFCRDMAHAANGWQKCRGHDPRIAQGIAELLEIRPA
jgi:hypothetical protein